MEIIIYILTGIASLFIWNVIHEASHVLAAAAISKIEKWNIKPYPHFDESGSFRFARSEWTYVKSIPTNEERAIIYLAPRIANLISILLLFVAFFLTGVPQIVWLIIFFSGTVDLIVGSLGISNRSDLQRVSMCLYINPWIIRIPGFVLSALSILLVLIILL